MADRVGDARVAGIKTVVVATDGSDWATRAVEYAVDLAERYGACLHVVSVVDASVLVGDVHHDLVVGSHGRRG